ncbi:MAG: membrane protein insertion efficiency factor YidD [Candidatus Portnoybacteria bacterium CG09_land_8_20_14_0_10_44_13]|uniref:Putative membrane protein insertion efficiency factor n=3 Tax=Parcubacteria group TaxID=1794811 RepID=A0A2H0WUT2_9BACT|nr:MAG: membrane protein insertion efficiency factor YidD [Candidatus Nealsonbacteria bacterium CG11_big_fil_rev_8_21_14_0_20_35_11]PIS16361.1 MAG: membrane protein insertion efficiency factor YidD [Candidatus Portnoybacteria bacterium CG09_land_8_20_14_0_10_44_13]PIZ70988.1 MAG: membrane protein insertion efficiency factor YidD [Candidatus Portnoybacteria bacterium CG_4_10_14_0_2_um_filter_44_20]
MIKKIFLRIIRGYQWILSPDHRFWKRADEFHGCRFYPSCSEYTYQAIEKYGVRKGIWAGVKRILRCHPWSVGGVDKL